MSDNSDVADAAELDALREEVERLRKYRYAIETQAHGLGALAKLSALVWAGPGLSTAFRNWIEASGSNVGRIPVAETADLLAAVVRRLIRVGLIAMFLAIIPTVLLFWQNMIMKDQYAALIQQIEEQRRDGVNQQVTQHFPLLLDGDRSRFWAAVSFFASSQSLTDEALKRLSRMLLEGEGGGACAALEAMARLAPVGGLEDGMRVRDITAALIPYIDHQKPPLSGIEIRQLKCPSLRLRQAGISQLNLSPSNLQQSEFSYADIAGVTFQKSDLRGARFLHGVQWMSNKAGRSVDMTDADLRSAYFEQEIHDVLLDGARLEGALFTWVTGKELMRIPVRYFSNAVCMSPNDAQECHAWHRNKLFDVGSDGVIKPKACPDNLLGPVVLVFGHQPDRAECESWVASAQQGAAADAPQAARR
jgi:hypothetical protein